MSFTDEVSLFKCCRTKSCGASVVEFPFFLHPMHCDYRYPAFSAGTGWCLRWVKKLNGNITIQNKDTAEVFSLMSI